MEPFWPRHSPHFAAVRRAVREWPGPAVIGLSGGADSLALVAAAAAEQKDVEAIVVDHQLQPGSREVAEQAATQARELGIPARVVAVAVAAGNVEAQAREARYTALIDEALDRDIWIAHTADDQAETLILGALRGNPAGMSPRTGQIVRPLLTLRRADTEGTCAELGLTPWQDPMNHDPAYRRVRVRQDVIPLLADILGGDVTPALATVATRIAQDNEYLDSLATPTVDCVELASDHPAIRSRKLAAWLMELGVGVRGSSISDLANLCTNWHGQGPVEIGGGWRVVRAGGSLHARRG